MLSHATSCQVMLSQVNHIKSCYGSCQIMLSHVRFFSCQSVNFEKSHLILAFGPQQNGLGQPSAGGSRCLRPGFGHKDSGHWPWDLSRYNVLLLKARNQWSICMNIRVFHGFFWLVGWMWGGIKWDNVGLMGLTSEISIVKHLSPSKRLKFWTKIPWYVLNSKVLCKSTILRVFYTDFAWFLHVLVVWIPDGFPEIVLKIRWNHLKSYQIHDMLLESSIFSLQSLIFCSGSMACLLGSVAQGAAAPSPSSPLSSWHRLRSPSRRPSDGFSMGFHGYNYGNISWEYHDHINNLVGKNIPEDNNISWEYNGM